jgi:hypothetical protein
MKKVKLSVESLSVESFPTASEGSEFGTVNGHEIPTGKFTCNESCAATCRTVACPCLVSEFFTQCIC